MSTPKLRDNEIAMNAQPRAMCVTTKLKMPTRRYHYVAGAWTIWRRTGNPTLVRMAVHTRCRQWISLPVLVDNAPYQEICDLCVLHEHRDFEARVASGKVSF